jgi:hypothetical protein
VGGDHSGIGGGLEETIAVCQQEMGFGATKTQLFEVPASEDLISPAHTLDYLVVDTTQLPAKNSPSN